MYFLVKPYQFSCNIEYFKKDILVNKKTLEQFESDIVDPCARMKEEEEEEN